MGLTPPTRLNGLNRLAGLEGLGAPQVPSRSTHRIP